MKYYFRILEKQLRETTVIVVFSRKTSSHRAESQCSAEHSFGNTALETPARPDLFTNTRSVFTRRFLSEIQLM